MHAIFILDINPATCTADEAKPATELQSLAPPNTGQHANAMALSATSWCLDLEVPDQLAFLAKLVTRVRVDTLPHRVTFLESRPKWVSLPFDDE